MSLQEGPETSNGFNKFNHHCAQYTTSRFEIPMKPGCENGKILLEPTKNIPNLIYDPYQIKTFSALK